MKSIFWKEIIVLLCWCLMVFVALGWVGLKRAELNHTSKARLVGCQSMPLSSLRPSLSPTFFEKTEADNVFVLGTKATPLSSHVLEITRRAVVLGGRAEMITLWMFQGSGTAAARTWSAGGWRNASTEAELSTSPGPSRASVSTASWVAGK